jgi:pyruvate/oxaloacetate carboxyltransferase
MLAATSRSHPPRATMRETLSRTTQELSAKTTEIAEAERRLQQVRDAQAAAQTSLPMLPPSSQLAQERAATRGC